MGYPGAADGAPEAGGGGPEGGAGRGRVPVGLLQFTHLSDFQGQQTLCLLVVWLLFARVRSSGWRVALCYCSSTACLISTFLTPRKVISKHTSLCWGLQSLCPVFLAALCWVHVPRGCLGPVLATSPLTRPTPRSTPFWFPLSPSCGSHTSISPHVLCLQCTRRCSGTWPSRGTSSRRFLCSVRALLSAALP